MTFDKKINYILSSLATKPDRKGELTQILEELQLGHIKSDIKEFRNYLKQTSHCDTIDISKGRTVIILNQTGIDYLNNFDKVKENEKRDEDLKNLQLLEVSKKVEIIERQIEEQSKFWTSSTNKKVVSSKVCK